MPESQGTGIHDAGGTITRRSFLERGAKLAVAAATLPSGLTIASKAHAMAPAGTRVKGALSLTVFASSPAELGSWNFLRNLFKAQYPDVDLAVHGVAADSWAGFFSTVSTQIAGGQKLDVVYVATEGQRLFVDRGLAMPIDDYLHRDQHELAEFFADVAPNFRKLVNSVGNIGGHTYYLPGSFNTMCIWYSRKAFRAAGLPYPHNNWTWDEFHAAAAKLAKPGKQYAMLMETGYFTGIMPWLLTNGTSVLNHDWTKQTVDSPQAVQAVSFMRDFVARKWSPTPGGQFDQFSAMAQGKLAMFGGGQWPGVELKSVHFLNDVAVVDWPQKTRKGSPVGWGSYPIMKVSQNKEAAWALVKFLTSKTTIERLAVHGGTEVPVRRSVATGNAYLKSSPKGISRLYNATSYATPIPAPEKENLIESAVIDSLQSILTGATSVQSGLKSLGSTIGAAL